MRISIYPVSYTHLDVYKRQVSGTSTAVEKVQINLTHTWAGDLEIYLQAPNGQRIALSTDNGGSADNYTNTMFVDGAPSITGGSAPFTGMFSPEGAVGGFCTTPPAGTVATLAAFTPGAGMNGTWQLRIADSAFGDGGTMLGWSIQFAAPPEPADPCEIVCPQNITYNLDPGACEQIINWNPPTTTGDCAVPVLEPGTVSQNNSETAVDDALGCTGAGDRHVRAYDLIEEGIAGDFQMTSLRMSAWNSGTVQVRVYTYTCLLYTSGDINLPEFDKFSYAFLLGYRFNVENYDFTIEPSITVKDLRYSPFLIDANVKFSFLDEQLVGGVGYTLGDNSRASLRCV